MAARTGLPRSPVQPSTLRTTHPDVLATTLDILDDTTRCWAEAGIAFSVEVMEDDTLPLAPARRTT